MLINEGSDIFWSKTGFRRAGFFQKNQGMQPIP